MTENRCVFCNAGDKNPFKKIFSLNCHTSLLKLSKGVEVK